MAIAVIGFGLALTVTALPAQAQYFGQDFSAPSPNIEGFTVAGKASLAAKPNLIEIDVEVSASSELTADAIVKYRDARRRLQEAFTALKLADVTVEERGLQVDQKGQNQNNYYWGGGMPNPAQQDRGAALAKTHRQGDQPPQDGRGGVDAIDRETSRCCTRRRAESRAAE